MATPLVAPDSSECLERILKTGSMTTDDEKIQWLKAFCLLAETLNFQVIEGFGASSFESIDRSGSSQLTLSRPSRGIHLFLPRFLLCSGTLRKSLFPHVISEAWERSKEPSVQLLGTASVYGGSYIRFEVNGFNFNLFYRHTTELAALSRVPRQLEWSIGLEKILDHVEKPNLFCKVHQAIRFWTIRRGLYSARIGHFDEYGMEGQLDDLKIALMLLPVWHSLSHNPDPDWRIVDVVKTFFAHYKNFDFESETCGFLRGSSVNLRKLGRLSEALLDSKLQVVDHGDRGTFLSSTRTIYPSEFSRASGLLDSISPIDLATSEQQVLLQNDSWIASGLADFLEAFSNYIRLDLRFWGTSTLAWAEAVKLVEDKTSGLYRRIASIEVPGTVRVWPSWLTHDSLTDQNARPDVLTLLIGYQLPEQKSYSSHFLQVWLEETRVELQQLQKESKFPRAHFEVYEADKDAVSGLYNSMIYCRQDKLQMIMESLRDDLSVTDLIESKVIIQSAVSLDSSDDGQKTPDSVVEKAGLKKGRAALDVLNRLRWDPSHDVEAYVVGYSDRFDGIQEMSASKWGADTTHDDFIPQHRIVYFKRTADGQVVWDRKQRIDEIFGDS